MTVSVSQETTTDAWDGFHSGLWQKEINVRDFIQQNYEPYDGDGSFLKPATPRTERIWKTLTDLFVEERKKGVLDVSQIPSSITAHAPGYIDRENEVIVGLQTEAPLKRAIMPNGGFRLVVNALKAFGYEPDPTTADPNDFRPINGNPIVVDGLRFQDARASYGISLMTFALGFPIHFDWSWRTLMNREWEDVVYSYDAVIDGWTGRASEWFRRPKFSVWIGYDF